MMAVDTSALMAILLNEAGADACVAALGADGELLIGAACSMWVRIRAYRYRGSSLMLSGPQRIAEFEHPDANLCVRP